MREDVRGLTTVETTMPETATERREALHRLVDELPEPDVDTATRVLEALRATADPVLRSLLTAPEENEPISDEERAAIEEGMEDIRAGRVHSLDEVKKELGLS